MYQLDRQKIRGIRFKVVGVTFEGRQEVVKNMTKQSSVYIEREPNNQFDVNAIKVMTGNLFQQPQQVGYIGKEYARVLAPLMDQGFKFGVRVVEVDCYNGTWYCAVVVDEI